MDQYYYRYNKTDNSKFDGNFKVLGTIDIENIKKVLLENKHKFSPHNNVSNNPENLKRTKGIGKTHACVKHLTFLFEDSEQHPKIINNHNKTILPQIENDFKHITNIVHKYYNDTDLVIARCLATELIPNSIIPLHEDGVAKILLKAHRIHIPIITNDLVTFTVGGEERNLKAGTMYEINNLRTHGVQNNSNENRMHLILDYINLKYLNDN